MVDQKTKQDIYETYMAKASQELSKQDVFDMNSFQRYMKSIQILQHRFVYAFSIFSMQIIIVLKMSPLI